MVTYNLAKDWDIDAIIKNCEEAKFEGVELRTTHAHKVEVNLTANQREDVRKRFHDSSVELMGLGSTFDYHTPDQAQLRKDIEATKEYIKLAHDVGARGVKVRPNGLPKDVPQQKTLEQIGKSLREIRRQPRRADSIGSARYRHVTVAEHQAHHGRRESSERRRVLEFKSHRFRRARVRFQFRFGKGQNFHSAFA